MGRTHRWKATRLFLEDLAASSFRNFSLDLVYGLPNQSIADVLNSAREMMVFKPTHVTAYCVSSEPETQYGHWETKYPAQVPTTSSVLKHQRAVENLLKGYGLYRYEVNSYARPGSECRHNLRYWQGGDYLGLGLGGASRLGTEVFNNPRSHVEFNNMLNSIGTDDDQIAVTAGGESTFSNAPIPDSFMQLRSRLGYTQDGGAIPARWISDGLMQAHDGQLEMTSRGLNLSENLSLEIEMNRES